MRAWFLQGEQGSETETLGCLVRQWASRPENNRWHVECLPATPELAALARTRQPDVLLLADASPPLIPSVPGGGWWAEILAQGVGLVVASALEDAENLLPLAEQHVVQVLALPASVESVGAALLSAGAAVRRQRDWQARLDQLQQRLNDRILIERAKGVLVERLSIPEKEAYQRLRLQSRRQRRPIRDIAQCLLDAQPLLASEMNGLAEPSNHRADPSAADRSRAQT
ncbi:MAG: ANTAR domain-containing protein [Gemmataceae bacterium]